MTTCPTCGRRLSERNGAGSEPDTCSDSCHDLADRAEELRDALQLIQTLWNSGRHVDQKGYTLSEIAAYALEPQ